MKRIIALILSLAMMLTLFAGLNISAEETDLTNTVMVAKRIKPYYNETTYNMGQSVGTWLANKGTNKSGFVWDGGWTFDAPVEPDGHHLSMRLTSKQLCGNAILGTRTYFTLTPGATIKKDVDTFMMYVELPEYNKHGNQWELNSLTFNVTDNGKSLWKTPVDMTLKYLENNSTEWVTTTVDSTGKYQLPNGFKGYVKMYFDTAKTGGDTATSYYDTLTAGGFTLNDGWVLNTLQFEINYLGGAYGDLVVGGMYQVESDGDALTANVSNKDDGSHAETINLTGTNRHTPDGTLKFWNQRANYGVEGTAIGGSQPHFEMAKATLTWEESHIGSPSAIAKISSASAIGAKHGVTARLGQYVWTPVDPAVGIVAMYVELPKYDEANGETWVMQTKGFNVGSTWYTPTNMRISYLATDSREWVESVTGNAGEFYLPNGFKGYIKMYLKTATNGGTNNVSYYDALAAKGIDMSSTFTIAYPQFDFNHLGGDYGDLYISQLYTVKEDGDDLVGNFTDWKYGEYKTNMTTGEYDITAERVNAKYLDGTTIYEGAAVSSGVLSVGQLDWYDAGELPTATWTASKEPDTTNASIRVHSDTATGQGVPYGPPSLAMNTSLEITPGVDTGMIYIELPEQGVQGVDGTGHGEYVLSFNSVRINQPGITSNRWGRLFNMTISYLGLEDTEWTTITNDKNTERLYLPSGFKGYVKLHFDTAIADPATGQTFYEKLETQGIDTTKNFTIDYLQFIFGWLGGKFGDFVLGGIYSVKEDGNSITANINDKGSTEVRETSLTNFKNANQERIELITNTITEIGDSLNITHGSKIEAALEAYAELADVFKAELPEGTIDTLNAYAAQYDALYRPVFGGVAAFKPDGSGYAGMKILASADASAAIAEGYYVTEYGTVALKETNFSASNSKFDATVANAIVESNTNSDNAAADFAWKSTIKTNNVADFGLDYYFRAYVVYSNGTDTITVWNADYENTALRTYDEVTPADVKAAGRLPIQTIKTTNPYLVISLAGAANKFGFSIMGGSSVGNVDGIFELGTYSNGWQNYVYESITSSDLVVARKYLLGKANLKYWYTADMNSDGGVDIRDLVNLKKQLANGTTDTVADASSLKKALATGKDVTLLGDITTATAIDMTNGGSINGNYATIDAESVANTPNCAVITTGGTIENLTLMLNEKARGIGSGSSGTYTQSSDLTVNNVIVDGGTYALNTSGNGECGLYVNNSKLYGWTSYANLTEAKFNNVTFGLGNARDVFAGAEVPYGGYVALQSNTVFTNCEFGENFHIGIGSEASSAVTIELVNCYLNGTLITADNFADIVYPVAYDSDSAWYDNATVIVDGVTVEDKYN